MAKSFDRKFSSINDDIIKDTLKTGLKSIKASDELIEKTLKICKAELNKEPAASKRRFITPWVYKLGAPIAAGALILVLIINSNQMLMGTKNQASAPEAAPSEIQFTLDKGETLEEATSRAAESVSPSSTPESVSPSSAPGTQNSSDTAMPYVDFGKISDKNSAIMTLKAPDISSLNSYGRHSTWKGKDPSYDIFNSIVSHYNSVRGTAFTLDEQDVTRIDTVLASGVSADTLSKSDSYMDILSGEGYWLLLLKNSEGFIETALNVSKIDLDNPDMDLAGNDLTISIEGEEFLASENPAGGLMGSEINLDSLTKMINAKGYKNISKVTVADINYGMDYLVFIETDGEELAVPFLTNHNLLGLENKSVYTSNELFNMASMNMSK